MRGRKPTPSSILALTGNPGHRPLNADEPRPSAITDATAPAWLDPLAREEWTRLGPELLALGLLTVADLPSFAAYCSEVGIFREAQAELAKRPKAKLKGKAQLLGARRKAAQEIRKWAAEFGFTPSARARIKSAPPEKKDPLSKYLRTS